MLKSKHAFFSFRRLAIPLVIGIGSMLSPLARIQIASAQEGRDNENLRAEEVLVIANKASEDSMAVAQHYMSKRKIPRENIFTIWFPKQKHHRPISHVDFQEKIVRPLQDFLEKKGLKEKILALVTVYDVPYKVAGPSLLVPKLGKNIANNERLLEEMRADPNAKATKIQHLRENIAREKAQRQILKPIWDALLAQEQPASRKRAQQILANHAALDSELAWLFRSDVYGPSATENLRLKAYLGRSRNPYFAQGMKFREFRKRSKAAGFLEKNGMFYLTARLEGPTVAISKNLVDSALQAEKEGPSGIGCFDARQSTIGHKKSGHALGEAWVRRANIETRNAGFQTKLDERKTLFEKGACPNPLFYWGWYDLQNYQDAFESHFSPGAFAVHTASGEASNIRHFDAQKKNPWCAGLLAHGAAFCSGPISEPFLDAFPHADFFYPRIFKGWSAGEAYWASKAYSSWMMVMIGDPLYAPFSGKNRLNHYAAGRISLAESGQKSKTGFLSENKRYNAILGLKANSGIFKSPERYTITGFKTSHPKYFKLSGFEKIALKAIDQETVLLVRGLQLETGAFGHLQEAEFEITIDLGLDGGEKIISQIFRLQTSNPP